MWVELLFEFVHQGGDGGWECGEVEDSVIRRPHRTFVIVAGPLNEGEFAFEIKVLNGARW